MLLMDSPAISSSYFALANDEDKGRARRRKNEFCRMTRSIIYVHAMSGCALLLIGILLFLDEKSSISPLHLISIALIGLVAVNMRRTRRWSGSTRRRQSMKTGFQQIVKTVADAVRNDNDRPTTRTPESGVYQVEFQQTSILDTVTNRLLHGGYASPSVLTIHVNRDFESSNGGWLVQGIRKSRGNEFYVLSEGFIAASGKAYWVEKSRRSPSLLVTGYFCGASFTRLEWLSSSGDRGRYTDFTRVKAVEVDTAVVLSDDDALKPSDSSNPTVETAVLLV